MSWRTNGLAVQLRNIGRNLGVNKWIASYILGAGYETRYDESFSGALRPGDCVWDVGANVGYYTRLFSERTGPGGRVFAFEPSPANFALLTSACSSLGNVTLLHSGLGKDDGKLHFQQGSDTLGATSRIVEPGLGGLVVDVRSGAGVIERGDAAFPNAIKIDVEGFEAEVLAGLGDYIKRPDLRLMGIEIHFGILKGRGFPHAPEQIESLLDHSGFHVKWPDPSHIIARRDV